jgi:ATP-dependent RNA helicase RhlE
VEPAYDDRQPWNQGGQRINKQQAENDLVASDVAARGIDVAHGAHIINLGMPKVAEDFVHRVGCTGRAAASDVVSTFASLSERGDLRKIERVLDIKMKRLRVRALAQNAA